MQLCISRPTKQDFNVKENNSTYTALYAAEESAILGSDSEIVIRVGFTGFGKPVSVIALIH